MKKNTLIGLVAVSNHNYGSLLQTYAIHQVLKNIGVNNEIIKYKQNAIKQLKRIVNLSFFAIKWKSFSKNIRCKIKYPKIAKGLSIRARAFESFKELYCEYSPFISERDELERYVSKYDAVVLGSDQVWHPANLEMDYFTLNFVPENIPKIAYASSFGVATIPKKQKERTAAYLKRIQFISVRETTGAKIVNELTGRNVPVVCDPTALLTRKQWDEIKTPNRLVEGQYIFCYFLGANSKHRGFANRVKEITGYKIVALQHIDEFVKGDLQFGDITPYDVGPRDFINLLSHAEIVLTDSFHGTMFSIYYHKKFFTFLRFSEGKKESTNSRIASILNLMNLMDRRLTANEDVKACLEKTINWDDVQSRLDKFRNDSIKWFTDSLREEKIIE